MNKDSLGHTYSVYNAGIRRDNEHPVMRKSATSIIKIWIINLIFLFK